MSKWVGQSEKFIRQLFISAQARKPSIVFFDEIDSIATMRSDSESESSRRIKTELLIQMQGINDKNDGVLVLAATNLPWQLDSAVRRRFEKRIYIGLPDKSARVHIMKLHVHDVPNNITEQDYEMVAEKTAGFTGSDLQVLCRHAIMEPIRRLESATHFKNTRDGRGWTVCQMDESESVEMSLAEIDPSMIQPPDVTVMDLLSALDHCKLSVSRDDLERYEHFTKEFGLSD